MKNEDVLAVAIGYALGLVIVVIFVVAACGYGAASAWNGFAPAVLGFNEANWGNGCRFISFLLMCRLAWFSLSMVPGSARK